MLEDASRNPLHIQLIGYKQFKKGEAIAVSPFFDTPTLITIQETNNGYLPLLRKASAIFWCLCAISSSPIARKPSARYSWEAACLGLILTACWKSKTASS